MPDNTVVPKIEPLAEDHFHAIFLQALSRLITAHGEGKVALWLGVSVRQLRNIKAGSLPTADKIWNLLAHDRSAHDEIDRQYGARKVPSNAICSTDPVSADMAALLTKAIEAEDPESPGGRDVTLHEIISMPERVMRDVHRTIGGWIERLEDARGPALKVVP